MCVEKSMIIFNWAVIHHIAALDIAIGKIIKKKKVQTKIGMYFVSRN
jgi:high-affinity nickel permease